MVDRTGGGERHGAGASANRRWRFALLAYGAQGGGRNGDGGTITISGGIVNATSGGSAAGIGGGAGGTITISGGSGTATATPSPGWGTGYAVGPGDNGSGGTFNGGAFPTANPHRW